LILKDLGKVIGEGWTGAAKTEQVLLKAFVVTVEDCKWGSQCEEAMGRWE